MNVNNKRNKEVYAEALFKKSNSLVLFNSSSLFWNWALMYNNSKKYLISCKRKRERPSKETNLVTDLLRWWDSNIRALLNRKRLSNNIPCEQKRFVFWKNIKKKKTLIKIIKINGNSNKVLHYSFFFLFQYFFFFFIIFFFAHTPHWKTRRARPSFPTQHRLHHQEHTHKHESIF